MTKEQLKERQQEESVNLCKGFGKYIAWGCIMTVSLYKMIIHSFKVGLNAGKLDILSELDSEE